MSADACAIDDYVLSGKVLATFCENQLELVPAFVDSVPSSTPDEASVRRLAEFSPLKDRLLGRSDQDFSAEEILLLLLGFLYSPEQARAATASLMQQFGSLGAILNAPARKLSGIVPRADDCRVLLRCVHHAMALVLREPIESRPPIKSWPQLQDYLRVSLSHEENEVVRLLLLDRRNHLIKDQLHSKGTDNNTPVYPREIVRRVLECNAGALIIVHNHPTGDPTPSEQDIINTRELAEILRGIDIYLHDHVIVGRLRAVSMKQLGYL